MTTRARKKASSAFQLKIALRDINPAIWRRLLVRSDIILGKLHFVINEAMGWTCSHLHSFSLGDRTFAACTGRWRQLRLERPVSASSPVRNAPGIMTSRSSAALLTRLLSAHAAARLALQ